MTTASDIAALRVRLDALEAESAIRRVMADYMRLCDRLDADTPMDEMGALFTTGAVWAGKGERYGAAFGGHQGRDAILTMLDRYRGPVPHFVLNAHFLTSETVRVDGGKGQGGWVMLQAATYADGTSDLRAARLSVGFAVEDGAWRIARFETESLFARPFSHWDAAGPPANSAPANPAMEG